MDEVIVLFPDVDTRDIVRRAASNLAGMPNAGIRLEVPEFLRPSLRALESTSFLLKKKFPTLKRHVKFDDEVLDLVMDLKMTPDAQWQKMRPAQAIEAKKGQVEPSRESAVELDSAAITSFLSSGPAPQGGSDDASGS